MFRHTILLRHAEIAKDQRPTPIRRLIGHTRHDVNVDMRMLNGFGELDDIGFSAVDRFRKRLRGRGDQEAQFDGFRSRQVGNYLDMPARHQHNPAGKCGVVGVYNIPILRAVDVIPERAEA